MYEGALWKEKVSLVSFSLYIHAVSNSLSVLLKDRASMEGSVLGEQTVPNNLC